VKIPVISFTQPAGVFYLANMKATDVIKIANISWRKYIDDQVPSDSVQREPSPKRIREITAYSETVDASFPTPILLALKEGTYQYDEDQNVLEIPNDQKIADVVDGQHRILGLTNSLAVEKFELAVIFIFDATDDQKALIFATVNGKQTKVPASLVFDLFGITEGRSPQKTAHEIAQSLNSSEFSPWYRRLKMLGKKVHSNESITQGMFVNTLLPLISKNPQRDRNRIKTGIPPERDDALVFNKYFCDKEDSTILKILLNIFSSVKLTWPEDWDNPGESILARTVGFVGIMNSIPKMVEAGNQEKNLSIEFFNRIFEDVRQTMAAQNLSFKNVENFPSSGAGPNNLKKLIETSVVAVYGKKNAV
jgi:DGQHR domain-containing protein